MQPTCRESDASPGGGGGFTPARAFTAAETSVVSDASSGGSSSTAAETSVVYPRAADVVKSLSRPLAAMEQLSRAEKLALPLDGGEGGSGAGWVRMRRRVCKKGGLHPRKREKRLTSDVIEVAVRVDHQARKLGDLLAESLLPQHCVHLGCVVASSHTCASRAGGRQV